MPSVSDTDDSCGARDQQPVSIVICDLDNTLWSWIDFFGPAIRAVVEIVRKYSLRSEADIYRSLKSVYSRRGAPEYFQVLEEFDALNELPKEDRRAAIDSAIAAFESVKRSALVTYPGVDDVLGMLRQRDYRLAAVTNAAAGDAIDRLTTLRILNQFDVVVAWDGVLDDGTVAYRPLETAYSQLHVVPSARLKPHPEPFRTAIDAVSCGRSAQVWIVGDSPHVDLSCAGELKGFSVWARYGTKCDAANLDTVVAVSHFDSATIRLRNLAPVSTPDAVIDSFGELLTILPARTRDAIGNPQRWWVGR